METKKESMFEIVIGSFGTWHFTIRKKRANGFYETPFVIEGAMVTDMDKQNIWLRGTDGVEYLVSKKRISKFEPLERNEIKTE